MRRYSFAILFLLVFFLLSSAAMAQTHQHQHDAPQPERGPGWDCPSPEQCEALVALRKEHHQAVLLPMLELRAKEAQLDVLLAAPQVDQEKITAVTSEIAALYGKILAAQNDYRRKVFEETGHLIRGGMGLGGQMHGGQMMRGCPMKMHGGHGGQMMRGCPMKMHGGHGGHGGQMHGDPMMHGGQ
jgi:hypothetical protein